MIPVDAQQYIELREADECFDSSKIAELAQLHYETMGRHKNSSTIVNRRSDFGTVKKFNENFQKNKYVKSIDVRGQTNKAPDYFSRKCYTCGKGGHIAKDCLMRKREYEKSVKSNVIQANQDEETSNITVARIESQQFKVDREREPAPKQTSRAVIEKLPTVNIIIDGMEMEAIIDSGTQVPVFDIESIREEKRSPCGKMNLIPAFGPAVQAVMLKANIAVCSDFGTSHEEEFLIACVEGLNGKPLITPGMVSRLKQGAECTNAENREAQTNVILDVAQTNRESFLDVEPLDDNEESRRSAEHRNLDDNHGNIDENKEFGKQQGECETLKEAWEKARKCKNGYYTDQGLLYHRDKILGEKVVQLVAPLCRRKEILKMAHESVFGAHMGAKKTSERIRYSFSWPGLKNDVKRFCLTCTSCQGRTRVGRADKVPITPIRRPELPFMVCNVDIIGPIEPKSGRGHQYILCLVDQHTRWPEAVPLKSITAKATCEALLQIFMKTGIPRVLASDQGANFTAALTQEFLKQMGASPRFSTPGHPEANGLVERFNGILKGALHHAIRQDPRNWDRHIPFVLWAYREVPNSTTGVAPFQLMYGRKPQGPLSILKDSWAEKLIFRIKYQMIV